MGESSVSLKSPRRLLALVAALALAPAVQAATWTQLTNLPPNSAETMLLLTDGTLMVHSYDNPGNIWMRFSPASNGSYIDGTWSDLAPMNTNRIYFASHITSDGNLWLLGGEYSGPNLDANWTNTGEIYDSKKDTWTPILHHPEARYGDVPSMLLDHDKVLAGSLSTRNSYIYDLKTNTWSAAIPKFNNDRSDEETWVKLPDGKVLTYDLFLSISTGGAYADAYDPKTGAWSSRSPSDGSSFGSIPQLSSSAMGFELGSAALLRTEDKKGAVFITGATGHTATYQIGTNTWAPGPDIMGTLNGNKVLFGSADAPGAQLPSGHMIISADASPTKGLFQGPTQLFDYDASTGKMDPVSPPFPVTISDPAYVTRMLMLPTGQMIFTYGTDDVWVYTPDGKAPKKARPLPQALHYDGNGVFTLTGLRLNGTSAGASYGDDAEMDENYPIVSLSAGGKVRYARTYGWNSQVQQKKPSTTKLTLKKGTPAGTHQLVVSAAGIQSDKVCVSLTQDQVDGVGAPADILIEACAQ
ncbi:MAG TPA: hypothetical protein VGQ91_02350 [Ideonella sp.]|nr:hypothetical protein [Ideonella sp.]